MAERHNVSIKILWFEVTESQPKSAKVRRGNLLGVYQRFTNRFGSWRNKDDGS